MLSMMHSPTRYWPHVKDRGDTVRQDVTYREEAAEQLCNAGERCTVAVVLRQTAAQEPQPALPHLDGQGASREEELVALVALQVSYTQRLHGSRLGTGVTQRVEDKDHAHPGEQQDDPTVRTKDEGSERFLN